MIDYPVFPEPGLWMLLQQANEPRVSWVHHEKMPLYLHPAPQPQPVLSGYSDYGAAIPGIERPCTCHPDDNPPVPCAQQYALNECRAASEPTEAQIEAQHPDDAAVDRFAAAMKAKLAEKRAEGRGGWGDPEQCSTTYLAMLLRGHVEKGDPLDVGNFAMMLWNRGGATNEIEPTDAQIELPNIVKTAPERIYLVIGEDCPDDATFSDDEVTWCADKIDDNSIPYVRADRAALAAKDK